MSQTFLSQLSQRVSSVAGGIRRAANEAARARVPYAPGDVAVIHDTDVVVVGAGVSGLAAAISAGRAGARTLLVERQGAVGGLVTNGLVTPFSMQMLLPDGTLVIRGLVEELFDRLSAAGGTVRRWRDWRIPKLPVDPEIFKLVVTQMLSEAGVTVVLNTPLLHVGRSSGSIDHVIVLTKLGPRAIRCAFVVDATGEADVARACGVPCTLNSDVDPSILGAVSEALRRKGWVRRTEKSASLQFMIGNADLDQTHAFIVAHPEMYTSAQRGDMVEDAALFSYLWQEQDFFYLPHDASFKQLIAAAKADGSLTPQMGRWALVEEAGLGLDGLRASGTVIVNANRVMINPFDDGDVSTAMLEGQAVCFEIHRFLREHVPGFERSSIMAIAPYLGIRRGAQIIGEHVYTAEEREQFRQYDDVIGLAARKTAKPYEVPFSLMVPPGIDNLLVCSGKTVSCDDFLPYRVKPVCMILGQAAGRAAAMVSTGTGSMASISIRQVQRALLSDGVYLGDAARLVAMGIAPGPQAALAVAAG